MAFILLQEYLQSKKHETSLTQLYLSYFYIFKNLALILSKIHITVRLKRAKTIGIRLF
jgi:hypothetical protein